MGDDVVQLAGDPLSFIDDRLACGLGLLLLEMNGALLRRARTDDRPTNELTSCPGDRHEGDTDSHFPQLASGCRQAARLPAATISNRPAAWLSRDRAR